MRRFMAFIVSGTLLMPFYAESPFSIPAEAVGVTVDSTTTLVTGTISGFDWHGRASIKRRPSGDLVLAWRDGTAHNVNDGALHIKFSDDNGATWSDTDKTLAGAAVSGFPMNPTTLTAGEDAGEPWLYNAPNGDLLLHMWRSDYFVTANGTWQARSTDEGATWTVEGRVTFVDVTATEDTQNRTFATDDDFVIGDTIYAAARIYTSVALTASNMVLVKSVDSGITWQRVSIIATTAEVDGTGIIEAGIERIGENTIIAMLRDVGADASYQRISTDLGLTWGTLTDVTSTVGIAGRQRVYTRAHLKGQANWWRDPVLLMVGYVHQTPGAGLSRRNAVWVSRDHGDTWSTPFYIDTTADDGGYGDMFYDADNDRWVVVNYKGPDLNSADLKQYVLDIAGV